MKKSLVIAVLAGFVGSACLNALISRTAIAAASQPLTHPRIIAAGEFHLLDESGKSRARMMMIDGSPAIMLCDEREKPRMVLCLVKERPSVIMVSSTQKTRLWIGEELDGWVGMLAHSDGGRAVAKFGASKDGAGGVSLFDAKSVLRGVFGAAENDPLLTFFDGKGSITWSAP